MIVVGEALVDLVSEPDGRLMPRSGGAARNLAVAAARLGADVRFVGGLSDDDFGRRLRAELDAEGIDTTLAPAVAAPTTLAVVHVDEDGQPAYTFHLADTAALALRSEHLDRLPSDEPLHLSLGALTLSTPVVGDALLQLLSGHPGLTSLDPNVRPAFLDDPTVAAGLIAAAAASCDLLRCSDEDIALLHPAADPEVVAAAWLAAGAGAVVVTRGRAGAVAWTPDRRVEVPASDVTVVDTVGAGDTFGAGLLVALSERGVRTRADLTGLSTAEWGASLRFAVAAAAVTVSRPGADPPVRTDLTDVPA